MLRTVDEFILCLTIFHRALTIVLIGYVNNRAQNPQTSSVRPIIPFYCNVAMLYLEESRCRQYSYSSNTFLHPRRSIASSRGKTSIQHAINRTTISFIYPLLHSSTCSEMRHTLPTLYDETDNTPSK